jgi:hypothetical protein
MESARTLKANKKVEGKPCGWCQVALNLGEDIALCAACEKEHHAACWTTKAGCANPGCTNAPLKQLDPPPPSFAAAQAGLPPGMMSCPSCRSLIPSDSQLCLACKAITSPDGIYHGPKTTPKTATNALIAAIVGLFICGIVLGPLAISKANAAKREIKADPSLQGEGVATAALVIGIIDIIGWAIIIMSRAGGS